MFSTEAKFKLHQYLETRSLAIHNAIGRRTIVYLDLNYWIRLRRGEINENPQDRDFFEQVSRLHDNKQCIFPISEITFWEIMKQGDIQTRTATIRLIDRFSEGIAIANTEHRILVEVGGWLNSATSKASSAASELVWTKINSTMNYTFSQTIPDVFRERYLDYVSHFSLEAIIANKPALFKFKDDIIALNTGIKTHAHENKTKEEMFLSEVGGMIAEHCRQINETIEYNYFKLTGVIAQTDKTYGLETSLDKIMYYSFKNQKISDQLPAFHIYSSLHAWTRWIKKEFKDGNDTMDFMHATVALPYADFFLTERRLFAGISTMSLDTIYNCSVHWQYNDVITQLKNL